MKEQFGVIGLGRFGQQTALSLARLGAEVIALDHRVGKINEIADQVSVALVVDSTDPKALAETGVQNVDRAIVCIGEDLEASILTVMALKDLGVNKITAKSVTPTHTRILEQLGVDQVVQPELEMAERLSERLMRPGFLELLDFSQGITLAQVAAPKVLWGKNLIEAQLRSRWKLTVIGIQHAQGGKLVANPEPQERIEEGDQLILFGGEEEIQRLTRS